MTVLFYVLCAIASPSQCEEHVAPAPSVLACMTGAQAALADPKQLAREGWRVERWRCEGE